jgi:hypothetical protein
VDPRNVLNLNRKPENTRTTLYFRRPRADALYMRTATHGAHNGEKIMTTNRIPAIGARVATTFQMAIDDDGAIDGVATLIPFVACDVGAPCVATGSLGTVRRVKHATNGGAALLVDLDGVGLRWIYDHVITSA